MQIQEVGVIILGIKEDKETKICSLEGLENANNILKDFWNTINNNEKVSCNILNDDYIEVTKIEDKTIVVINIPSANRQNKPVYINNNPITGTYKRYHDGDYKCNKKEVKVMFSESAEESKDEMILKEFDFNNIDKKFLYMIGAVDRGSDKLTLAGLLMFGYNRDIIKIKPSFFLDYREIDDTDVHKSVRERTCQLPYSY